ncbi:MAG: RNA polymerase sigma factor [Spirochaetota bacterium]
MQNPFSQQYSEEENHHLVKEVLGGDKDALDKLIKLHQAFIYNVAWKMVHNPDDAHDLTQETLIKVITRLSQFNFQSSFRTWLYRIVMNEFLQTKRKKTEELFSSFEDHATRLHSIETTSLSVEEEFEMKELTKEMRIRCMSGMLMCLTREQRLVYIIGDFFGVNHKLGAEIFGISKENFRIKLHRSRKELHNYMHNNCGLINVQNSCRCSSKAKALKEKGLLNEKDMLFNISYTKQVRDYASQEYETVNELLDRKYIELYREHPMQENFDKESIIETIIQDKEILSYFN